MFLRIDQNKVELFDFLTLKLSEMVTEGKEIYLTYGMKVLSSPETCDISSISNCSQEEADTMIMLHVQDAVRKGCQSILIRIVDTDVVVLAIYIFHQLQGLEKLWVAFGTGNSFKYIPVQEIANSLGEDKSTALLFFHAFTGCNTDSSFSGIGKKKAWEAWKSLPNMTTVFVDQ